MSQIMTEEEARTKWCPFARVVHPAGVSAAHNRVDPHRDGRSGEPEFGTYCLASGCACWDWVDNQRIHVGKDISPPGEGWEKEHDGTDVDVWRRSVPVGRCSLGSKS